MTTSAEKPVLVLLHAFPLSSRMWDPNRRMLEKKFRLITPDLPGFGSKKNRRAATITAMARQVAAGLKAEGVRGPVVIGGLSMGGYVCLEFARLFPSKVRGLLLLATRASADTHEQRKKRYEQIRLVKRRGTAPLARAMLAKLLGGTSLRSRPSVVRSVQRLLSAAPAAGTAAALAAMARRSDHTRFLRSVRAPILIVAGREDAVILAEETRRMRDASKRATLRFVPRAGHLLNLECPVLFGGIISKFLARID